MMAGDSGHLTTTQSILWEMMNVLVGQRYYSSVSAAAACGKNASKILKGAPKPLLKPGQKPPEVEKVSLGEAISRLGGIKRR